MSRSRLDERTVFRLEREINGREIGELKLATHNFTGIVVGVTSLDTRVDCGDRIRA
ncbi:MAG: hypothetical protein V3R57_01155 [Candidatus Bathyarchaeia archaeon]